MNIINELLFILTLYLTSVASGIINLYVVY